MTKINFNAQNISWTEAMEAHATEAIERGMRRITIDDMVYTVKVSVADKKANLIKVELSGAGFRAQCTNKDFYSAMTAVVSKFKSLVLRHAKKTLPVWSARGTVYRRCGRFCLYGDREHRARSNIHRKAGNECI